MLAAIRGGNGSKAKAATLNMADDCPVLCNGPVDAPSHRTLLFLQASDADDMFVFQT